MLFIKIPTEFKQGDNHENKQTATEIREEHNKQAVSNSIR